MSVSRCSEIGQRIPKMLKVAHVCSSGMSSNMKGKHEQNTSNKKKEILSQLKIIVSVLQWTFLYQNNNVSLEVDALQSFNNYEYFGSLGRSMISLFGMILLAEWSQILRPVWEAQAALNLHKILTELSLINRIRMGRIEQWLITSPPTHTHPLTHRPWYIQRAYPQDVPLGTSTPLDSALKSLPTAYSSAIPVLIQVQAIQRPPTCLLPPSRPQIDARVYASQHPRSQVRLRGRGMDHPFSLSSEPGRTDNSFDARALPCCPASVFCLPAAVNGRVLWVLSFLESRCPRWVGPARKGFDAHSFTAGTRPASWTTWPHVVTVFYFSYACAIWVEVARTRTSLYCIGGSCAIEMAVARSASSLSRPSDTCIGAASWWSRVVSKTAYSARLCSHSLACIYPRSLLPIPPPQKLAGRGGNTFRKDMFFVHFRVSAHPPKRIKNQ